MKQTRLLVFSDSHEPAAFETAAALFDKRLIGLMNSRSFRRGVYDPGVLTAAVDRILSDPPDAVVFTGDATSTGQKTEFQAALARLRPLVESSIPLLYTPGNHDAYVNDPACRRALADFFRTLWRGRRELTEPPFLETVGGLRLVVTDNARPCSRLLSTGRMDVATSLFLDLEARRTEPGLPPLVCVGHFPLLERHPLLRFRHRLYGAGQAAELLRSHALDLSLCGHVHRPYALLDSTGRGEICAGSVTQYRVLTEVVYDPGTDCFRFRRILL